LRANRKAGQISWPAGRVISSMCLELVRYEIRCWHDGRIPDVDEAVDSPLCLSTEPEYAARILELVPCVPLGVWGRDEFDTGDMWNSNSLISWLIGRSGLEVKSITPPAGGRAPGWDAGLTMAYRQRGLRLAFPVVVPYAVVLARADAVRHADVVEGPRGGPVEPHVSA
jgi:hypothetical protein